jgi:serine phosphatase RsbU (regulator of sigma subunit)/CheY-like chemotaxis protein
MNIIIVDDNRTNQLVIEKILNKAGYGDVTAVSSARELFSLLGMESTSTLSDEVPVNLILMDMMMPEIDGIEATKQIHSNERFREIPIIFVTALGDSNKLAEAFDAGATDYVMKPINKVELLARIRSALRLKFEKDWHRESDKRIKFELELAKRVQRSILSLPIDNEKVAISAFYEPSFELAGDSYAWYPIDKNRYGIIILDMMGHGISSSLVCMFISSVLQDNIIRISDPEQVMRELNRFMNQLDMIDDLTKYYFTAIYMVLDTEQKTIEYVNAGHPPGIVYKDESVLLLTEGCCGLGLFDSIHISKGTIRYEDSIRIVLFTDGMMESNVDGAEDSIDKLLDVLKACKGMDLATLVDTCIPHVVNGSQKDDICVVMITTK